MPTLGWSFQDAAGADWLSPSAAEGAFDDLFALLPQAETEAAVLALTNTRDVVAYPMDRLPDAGNVTGLKVHLRALNGAEGRDGFPGESIGSFDPPGTDPEDPTAQLISVAITKDGSTAASSWRSIPLPIGADWRGAGDFDTPVDLFLGGEADLWGLTLSVAEANASTFGILVRRLSSDPGAAVGDVLLDAAVLQVTFTGGAPSGDQATMSLRDTARQFSRIGKETTRGEAVTPTIKPKAFRFMFNPNDTGRTHFEAGQKAASDHHQLREHSTGSIEAAYPTYDELGHLLRMMFGDPATSTLASGAYRHVWKVRRLKADAYKTVTHEHGEAGVAGERVVFAALTGLNIGLPSQGEPSLAGDLVARSIEKGVTLAPGANEVQRIVFASSPSGGTLKLSYNGEQTAAITAGGSMASAIETALNALSQIGADGVSVSGSATTYDITFDGTAVAGDRHPFFEVADNSITGTPAVTITRTTVGGFTELPAVPILPGHWDAYISTSYAGLSSGRLTACKSTGLEISNKLTPHHLANQALGREFSGLSEGEMDLGIPLLVESGANGMALLDHRRNNQTLFSRLLCTGPLIVSGFNHKLQVDMACKVMANDAFSDEEGIYAKSFRLGPRFDSGWGEITVITLENGVASY